MIRDARPDDARAIALVHIRSWQQAYRELLPGDYLKALDSTLTQREALWRQSINDRTQQVFVAVADEQIIGWISCGASRDDDAEQGITGEVSAVYVLAEYWGTGVGRELWLEAVAYLCAVGFGAVTLWVLVDNLRAIHFYRNAGLDPDLGSQRSITRGGRALAEIRYRKPLEPIC